MKSKSLEIFKKLKIKYQDKKIDLKNPQLQKIINLGLFIGIDYGQSQCYCELLDRKDPHHISHHLDSFRIDNRAIGGKEGLYILKNLKNE